MLGFAKANQPAQLDRNRNQPDFVQLEGFTGEVLVYGVEFLCGRERVDARTQHGRLDLSVSWTTSCDFSRCSNARITSGSLFGSAKDALTNIVFFLSLK